MYLPCANVEFCIIQLFQMRLFGLIGFPLGHSFSKKYFTQKFEEQGLADCRYELFTLPQMECFPTLLSENPDLKGLNITIPYKEKIIDFLDDLDASAAGVGAVNCIKIVGQKCIGYNTDVYGFEQSLLSFLSENQSINDFSALILGTGGAAKAVATALKNQQIPFQFVSRKQINADTLTYQDLGKLDWEQYRLVVNTTPLGMAPQTDACPDLPFEKLCAKHLIFDLVYNPMETLLLHRAAQMGAATKNGLEMLHLQAEKSWEIWNSTN